MIRVARVKRHITHTHARAQATQTATAAACWTLVCTHTNESCHRWCVHIRTSHVTHGVYTYERVMSHMVCTHTNESCHTCQVPCRMYEEEYRTFEKSRHTRDKRHPLRQPQSA